MSEQSGFQLSGPAPELYERYIVPALTFGTAKELVTLAGVKMGDHVLDVACGTGVVSRQAATAVGPGGEVTGLDVNRNMLGMARSIPPAGGLSISFREGSVLDLPFPGEAFDVVLCQHGLEFFPDRGQGLREMRRVLRQQGHLGIRVWRGIEQQAFHTALFAALDRYLWGGEESPSRTGFGRPFSLGDAEELYALVDGAGFKEIELKPSTGSIRLASTNDDLLGYISALPVGREIAGMEESKRRAMLEEVKSDLQPFVEQGKFVIPAECHVVIARK